MHPSDMQSTTNVEAPQSKEAPRTGWRARLGVFGALAAACLVVALFALVMRRSDGGLFGVSPNTPADWQTYRDPRGLFSARLPKQWATSVETSTDTFGDNTGSATEITEMIGFSDPALGEASARVNVLAAPIQSDFERHWYCQSFSQTTNPLHGISAGSLSPGPFLFDTANAHFQVSV